MKSKDVRNRVAGVIISVLAGILSFLATMALSGGGGRGAEVMVFCFFGLFFVGLMGLYNWLSQKL